MYEAEVLVDGILTPQPGGSRLSLPVSGGLSGSRRGLRGFEDLGGGLGGLFVLESGFGLDSGTLTLGGRFFGRLAYVGMVSGWGQITFGRQYTDMY
ncbi:porin [Cupriavidus necator]|uniref:porin n=1 Tax=Cupriavidus necator TaxID=106590 RepID=UPI0009B6A8C3